MAARLLSVQVGLPVTHEERERWHTAFFKDPVTGPVILRRLNLDGDRQADLKNHGGPDQAVLCYSAEHYPRWREELGRELCFGGFGENFTIEGLDEESVCLGDVYSTGEALVQVSCHRGPCYKIAYRWKLPELLDLVKQSGRTGWYLRVLREGLVQAGDPFQLLERPNPEWPIRRVYRAWRARKTDASEAALMASREGAAPDYAAQLRALAARS